MQTIPDITLEKLKLWITSSKIVVPNEEHADSTDMLSIHIEYSSDLSFVKLSDIQIGCMEMQNFLTSCKNAEKDFAATIELTDHDGLVQLKLTGDSLGNFSGNLELASLNLSEKHSYSITVDQTYLNETIRQIESALKEHIVTEEKIEPVSISKEVQVTSLLRNTIFDTFEKSTGKRLSNLSQIGPYLTISKKDIVDHLKNGDDLFFGTEPATADGFYIVKSDDKYIAYEQERGGKSYEQTFSNYDDALQYAVESRFGIYGLKNE